MSTRVRKGHTCCYCEQRIEKGATCDSGVEYPSSNPYLDAGPWRWYAHTLCRAFFLDRIWPELHETWEPGSWDEDMREGGWGEWLAEREAAHV